MFGDNIEDVIGPLLFMAAYVVCGMGGGALFWAFNQSSTIPCVGASAAVSGLMGMYVVFFPQARMNLVFLIPLYLVHTRAIVAILAWFGLQLLMAGGSEIPGVKQHVGIAFWGHVGGFLTGVALGLVFLIADFRDRYLSRYLTRLELQEREAVRQRGRR
jgi:membrane associated rhomboid family serine protease